MTRIIIQGIQGRMGRVLCELIAQRSDCVVVAGIDKTFPSNASSMGCEPPVIPSFPTLAEVNVSADVLIDFSHPKATKVMLPLCVQKSLPCVVCTTGLGQEVFDEMQVAAEHNPVFYSANMSLGIHMLITLAKKAAALLPGYDIEIVEKHHRNKLDAPSGTAMMVADAINRQREEPFGYQYNRQPVRQPRPTNEIGIHAVRGGSIVGEHEVIFAGQDEVLTLSHSAASRSVFASGAIAAALFIQGLEAGLYSMDDLLESFNEGFLGGTRH